MKIVNRTIKSGKDNTSHNNIVCVYHIVLYIKEDFLSDISYRGMGEFKRNFSDDGDENVQNRFTMPFSG